MSEPMRGGMLELHRGMYEDEPGHIGIFILRELEAREWTLTDVAERMGGDFARNLFVLEFACCLSDPRIRLGRRSAEGLGRAFGTSTEFWLGCDLNHRHMAAKGEWSILTLDCDCEACRNEPPEDHYVNGKLKREQMP